MRAMRLNEKSIVLGLFLLCFPWVIYGTEYISLMITELDHCPKLACDFTRHYLPQAQHVVNGDEILNRGWFYPPLLAILLIPFVTLNNPDYVWTLCNLIGCVLLIVQTSMHKKDPATMIWSIALVSTSIPVLHSLKWGQVSIWISVLLISALSNIHTISKWRSLVLGLAGAIKIYPMLFVLVPLFQRRLTQVVQIGCVFLLLGAVLPWLCLGSDITLYWHAIRRGQIMVSDIASGSGGQALSPTLTRWFVSGSFIGGVNGDAPILLSMVWLKWSLLSVATLGFVRFLWRTWQLEALNTRVAYQMIIGIHIFVQPGRVHYFSWLPCVQMWCWIKGDRYTKGLVVASVVLERIPLFKLSQYVYFQWSRMGVLTVSVMVLWFALERIGDTVNREFQIDASDT